MNQMRHVQWGQLFRHVRADGIAYCQERNGPTFTVRKVKRFGKSGTRKVGVTCCDKFVWLMWFGVAEHFQFLLVQPETKPNDRTESRSSNDESGSRPLDKLLGVALMKLEQQHIVLNAQDIERVEGMAVIVQELDDGLHIRVVTMAEGQRLAAEQAAKSREGFRTELAFPESQIEREIENGCTQKQIAQTYALALQIKSTKVDWKRINMAIVNKWNAKTLNRIKDMAHRGTCFDK